MIVKNKLFRQLFDNLDFVIPTEYKPSEFPYIGLGNPDSNILFVGSEKKSELSLPIILQHELILNFHHWFNIVLNHNNISDPFHPRLKLRGGQLNHFNPFSPLTLDETCYAVFSAGNHTYKRIQTIINAILVTHSLPKKSIFNISPKRYQDSVFSKCFLTELSDIPLPKQNGRWDFEEFKNSPRGTQIRYGKLGKYYRSFNKVVIYAGRNYTGEIGTNQREEIIQLFNPSLSNNDIFRGMHNGVDVYQKYFSREGGAEIIITESHIIAAMFNDPFLLGHVLGVLGIGAI